MKLKDIILDEISVSGEIKKVDTIVGAVSKAISEKYDIPNDGLLQGTIRVAVAGILSDLDEGINDNIGKVKISYTNYAKFYKMHVDGKRLFYDEANEMIKGLTGLELPVRAYYHSDDVLKVLNALKDKGIEADSYEMDVD